jgi:hypothetical protein
VSEAIRGCLHLQFSANLTKARAATSLRGEGATRALVELLLQRRHRNPNLRRDIIDAKLVPKNEQAHVGEFWPARTYPAGTRGHQRADC